MRCSRSFIISIFIVGLETPNQRRKQKIHGNKMKIYRVIFTKSIIFSKLIFSPDNVSHDASSVSFQCDRWKDKGVKQRETDDCTLDVMHKSSPSDDQTRFSGTSVAMISQHDCTQENKSIESPCCVHTKPYAFAIENLSRSTIDNSPISIFY